ncbi:MAG: hypothetical protein AB7O44_30310 [Hyphomicrobiaceae bacterium]
MLDFLNKLFNPGGPMDLSTGKAAAPTGRDIMGGVTKGMGLANILADTIGGTPQSQSQPMTGDLDSILAALRKRQGGGTPAAPPLEQLMQKIFGITPINPAVPVVGNRSPQLPTSADQIGMGTGGLY